MTQASSGATVAAGTPLAASTTITGANDEIDVDVNGSPLAVTLAAGSHGGPAGPGDHLGLRRCAQCVRQYERAAVDCHRAAGQHGLLGGHRWLGSRRPRPLELARRFTGRTAQIEVDGTTTTVNDIAGTGSTQVTLNSGRGAP